MEIRVIDFEKLTAHYKNYRDGIDEINQQRKIILDLVEPIRKEMNKIISSSTNGLIIDGKTKEQQAKKFQELQQELVSIDNDYKVKNKQMVDELNVKTFDELSIIVEDWAELNSIDVVSGKMEIIFCNGKYDVTDDIIEVLKEKELYVERDIESNKKEKESV